MQHCFVRGVGWWAAVEDIFPCARHNPDNGKSQTLSSAYKLRLHLRRNIKDLESSLCEFLATVPAHFIYSLQMVCVRYYKRAPAPVSQTRPFS